MSARSGIEWTGSTWNPVTGCTKISPGARSVAKDWVLEIRDQCRKADVPFFFKQWGGTRKKAAGRLLEGRTWDQMPAVVAV